MRLTSENVSNNLTIDNCQGSQKLNVHGPALTSENVNNNLIDIPVRGCVCVFFLGRRGVCACVVLGARGVYVCRSWGRGVVLFLEGVVWRCSWRCGLVFFLVCLFVFVSGRGVCVLFGSVVCVCVFLGVVCVVCVPLAPAGARWRPQRM